MADKWVKKRRKQSCLTNTGHIKYVAADARLDRQNSLSLPKFNSYLKIIWWYISYDLYMQKSMQIQNKKANFEVTYEKNTINYRNIHEPDYSCKFFFFQYERKTKTSKL